MKVVFSSFDWVEAQAVVAMLEGSGFKPLIWGADWARSGLHPSGDTPDVRVAVPDEEFAEASLLVEDYTKAKRRS
jgi:hypothetical protein